MWCTFTIIGHWSYMRESSGIIAVNDKGGTRRVLLLKSFGFWDFPKGGLDADESKMSAAIREMKEETGIGDIEFPWGKVYYSTEWFGRERKRVHYFIAMSKVDTVILEKNPITGNIEHDEYRWATIEDARELTTERIRKAIDWAVKRMSLY